MSNILDPNCLPRLSADDTGRQRVKEIVVFSIHAINLIANTFILFFKIKSKFLLKTFVIAYFLHCLDLEQSDFVLLSALIAQYCLQENLDFFTVIQLHYIP